MSRISISPIRPPTARHSLEEEVLSEDGPLRVQAERRDVALPANIVVGPIRRPEVRAARRERDLIGPEVGRVLVRPQQRVPHAPAPAAAEGRDPRRRVGDVVLRHLARALVHHIQVAAPWMRDHVPRVRVRRRRG